MCYGIKRVYNDIIWDKMFCVNWFVYCGKMNGFVILVNEIIEYNIGNIGLYIYVNWEYFCKNRKKFYG